VIPKMLHFVNLTNESPYAGVGMMGDIFIVCSALYNLQGHKICVNGNTVPPTTFYDKEYIKDNNIDNAWECYFENKWKSEEGYDNINLTPDSQTWILNYGGTPNTHMSPYVLLIKELFFNNFSVKETIMNEVDNFVNKNLTSNTLGVHWRGSDMANAGRERVNTYVNLKKQINQIIDAHPNIDSIFIASDDKTIITSLQKDFEKPIYYIDCYRSTPHNKHLTPFDRYHNDRKYHIFKVSKEVLVDTLILTKCTYFLRSYTSSVSECVLLLDEENNIKHTFIQE
tara:strand:+ start:417 stop:1265 length:849 start_codon:yes stop_codon:yes gene_type:complete